jgi:hypothetical protein
VVAGAAGPVVTEGVIQVALRLNAQDQPAVEGKQADCWLSVALGGRQAQQPGPLAGPRLRQARRVCGGQPELDQALDLLRAGAQRSDQRGKPGGESKNARGGCHGRVPPSARGAGLLGSKRARCHGAGSSRGSHRRRRDRQRRRLGRSPWLVAPARINDRVRACSTAWAKAIPVPTNTAVQAANCNAASCA